MVINNSVVYESKTTPCDDGIHLSHIEIVTLYDFITAKTVTLTEEVDNILKRLEDNYVGEERDPTDDFTEDEWQQVVDAACAAVTKKIDLLNYNNEVVGSYFAHFSPGWCE